MRESERELAVHNNLPRSESMYDLSGILLLTDCAILSSLTATVDNHNWHHRIDRHRCYSLHRFSDDSAISQETHLL